MSNKLYYLSLKPFIALVLIFFTANVYLSYCQIVTVKTNPFITLGTKEPLYLLEDIAVNGNFILVLTKQKKDFIKVFKKDRFVRSFGKRGPGPYEFENPEGICSSGNRISVLDLQPNSNKLVIFDLKGNPVKEIPLRGIQFASALNCYKGQKVLASSEFMGNEVKVFWIGGGKNVLKYYTPEAIEIHPPQGPMNTQHVILPFQPEPKWDLIGENRLVVWNGSSNKIFKITFRKDTLTTITVSNLHIPVSAKNIKKWINNTYEVGYTWMGRKNFYRGVREELFEYDGYVDYFPLMMSIKSGAGGSLWLLRATKNGNQIWTRYKEGEKPVTIKLPEGQVVYQFENNWIVTANKTDNGIVNLKIYKYSSIRN